MLANPTLQYATKEHTPAFKSAVERCKAANPSKDAGSCFAVVTSAFQKAKKSIFLSDAAPPDFSLDTTYGYVELAKWSDEYIKALPDSSFAYIEHGEGKDKEGNTIPKIKRHLPFKDLDGTADPSLIKIALANITNIPAAAKPAALRKLELADIPFEELSDDVIDYSTYQEQAFTDSQDFMDLTVELSGTNMQWTSLGHALQVRGELIKPGVYTGLDGKKCRWRDSVLGNPKYYKSLLGQPTRLFHLTEGNFRKIPVRQGGKIVGHITHLAEYFGRLFYKALVFPKQAQDLIKNKQLKESLEARVALSEPDASGVYDIKAWLGKGLAFTDKPAVKGTEDTETDPVALARNDTMGNDDNNTGDPAGQVTPPPNPEPPVEPQGITLSASDLQNIIKTAVGEATVELSKQVKEVTDELAKTRESLKELADVRNDARLAEIRTMEEDIKKHDDKFDIKTLYDPEKATLAERERALDFYTRGINKGVELQHAQKPAIQLSDPENIEKDMLDKHSQEMFGQDYDAMLASPPKAGGSE